MRRFHGGLHSFSAFVLKLSLVVYAVPAGHRCRGKARIIDYNNQGINFTLSVTYNNGQQVVR